MKTYLKRVEELEKQGLTTSDAQAVIQAEDGMTEKEALKLIGDLPRWKLYLLKSNLEKDPRPERGETYLKLKAIRVILDGKNRRIRI